MTQKKGSKKSLPIIPVEDEKKVLARKYPSMSEQELDSWIRLKKERKHPIPISA